MNLQIALGERRQTQKDKFHLSVEYKKITRDWHGWKRER